jgi:hypothetical protein
MSHVIGVLSRLKDRKPELFIITAEEQNIFVKWLLE